MKTTAREIEEKICKKEREQKYLQARLEPAETPIENNLTAKNVVREIPYCDYCTLMTRVEKFSRGQTEIYSPIKATVEDWRGNSDGLDEVLKSEDCLDAMRRYLAPNNLMFTDENGVKYGISVTETASFIDNWKYVIRAEKAPIENNLTVKVLAVKGFDRLMLNGKRISRGDADDEVRNAMLRRRNYSSNAVLYTDINVRNVLGSYFIYNGMCEWETKGAFKVADFGRDEIPYVNEKVDAIIAEYRAKAKAEDEEKARREAYEASDEGQLRNLKINIAYLKNQLINPKRKLELMKKEIVYHIGKIAECENRIGYYGLELEKSETELEEITAQVKPLENKIATKKAFVAIKAAAADIEDDDSNDDDEMAVDAFVEVEDDDDELADDLIIIKSKKAEFEIERFCEESSEVKELMEAVTEFKKRCDAEKALRDTMDAIRAKYETKKEELRKQIIALEDAKCIELEPYQKELDGLDSAYDLKLKVQDKVDTLVEGDTGIKMTPNFYGDTEVWLGDLFKISYLGAKGELTIEGQHCMSTYKTIEGFVNAVIGLANAINRGEGEYTFPAA